MRTLTSLQTANFSLCPHKAKRYLASSLNFSQFSSSLSRVQCFVTPWTTALQASLSFTISQSLLRLMPIESVMRSNHLILCHLLLLLPSIFPASGSFPMSQFFASGGQSIGASASAISPSNVYSGLISFRTDWFDLLTIQGTLKSLLQHHSSKASKIWCSAFFMVQLSHMYMILGKIQHMDLCWQSNISAF